MKKYSWLFLIPGALGAWLYRMIFIVALDESELIVRGGWAEVCLWVLTAGVFIAAAVLCRKEDAPGENPPLVASLALACGTFLLTRAEYTGPAPLILVFRVSAYAACASAVLAAVLWLLKKNHAFALDIAPCLMGILHMVVCYQMWSEIPQLLEYFFSLGAVLCVALFGYQLMAAHAKLPGGKMLTFSGLLGIFFCCTAAVGSNFSEYALCMAVWMIGNLTCSNRSEAITAE